MSAPAVEDEVVAAALAEVSHERLRDLVRAMVDVPSPTGRERPLAQLLVRRLDDAGLAAHLLPLDDLAASAWGRLAGDRTGRDLLLHAPIDTWSTGIAEVDVPWTADRLDDHARPVAKVVGDTVVGLGAMNPKGHAACVLAAAEAVSRSGVDLRGDLLVGFGAGGMPTEAWDDDNPRRDVGHGVGAAHLLRQGVWPDHAVVAKSFWGVSTEEVGVAWLDVTFRGLHGYVGARHRLPHDNPVLSAAEAVPHLEDWVADWSRDTAAGQVEPQASIAAVRGGEPRMAAGIAASCRLRLDVRLAPRVAPLAARRSLAGHLARAGIEADVELALAVPGTATSEDADVVRAAVAAWEAMEGRPHVWPTRQSGATDVNVLRGAGIPTVRVGLPKVERDGAELAYAAGMNTVELPAMGRLTELLVRVVLDLCRRPRNSPDRPPEETP